jgi:hypothetical protein
MQVGWPRNPFDPVVHASFSNQFRTANGREIGPMRLRTFKSREKVVIQLTLIAERHVVTSMSLSDE